MTRTWKWSGLVALVTVVSTAACSILTQVDRPEPAGAGGSGGGGGSGSGGSGGGGGASDALGSWTADAPDPATGVYTLPSWLVLESPSDNKTVQTGPDRVRTGFGVNAARARSVDGTTWGLNVESKRENRVDAARIAEPPWTLFSPGALDPATGPDGADLAAHVTDDTNQETSVVGDVTLAAGEMATFSAWVTTETTQARLECNACTPNSLPIDMGLGWHRASMLTTEAATGTQLVRLIPTSGGNMEQGAATFDFVNVETGRYPSSAILTTGAPATREDEKLYATSASDLAPGGFFHVFMVFAPNYASGEEDGDHDLLFFDAQNRVYVRASDNAIVFQAEGTDVLTTPPLTWARDQELRMEVMNLESGRTLQVTGANEGDQTVTDPTAGAFPVTGALHLLGSDGGSQECADLRSIAFYRPM